MRVGKDADPHGPIIPRRKREPDAATRVAAGRSQLFASRFRGANRFRRKICSHRSVFCYHPPPQPSRDLPGTAGTTPDGRPRDPNDPVEVSAAVPSIDRRRESSVDKRVVRPPGNAMFVLRGLRTKSQLGLSVPIGRSTRGMSRNRRMPMTRMFDKRCVWGLRVVAGVVGFLSLALAVQAELPPREYRRMQREAPEEVRIHVLRVEEAPLRERPREREIVIQAKVVRIARSAARIHEGEVIRSRTAITATSGKSPAPANRNSWSGAKRIRPFWRRWKARDASSARPRADSPSNDWTSDARSAASTPVSRRKRPFCRRLPPRDRCLWVGLRSHPAGGSLIGHIFLALHREGRGCSPSWEQAAPQRRNVVPAERPPAARCPLRPPRGTFRYVGYSRRVKGPGRRFGIFCGHSPFFCAAEKSRKIQLVPKIVQRLHRPRGVDTWVNETIAEFRGASPASSESNSANQNCPSELLCQAVDDQATDVERGGGSG